MQPSKRSSEGQQNIAQVLAELPGAITTMLSRAQAPTRRMLVDRKGLGKPPAFSGREEDFCVWAKKVENYVSGVFPNVRGAPAFAAESQDAVTAAAVALRVHDLDDEVSAEIDGQLFIVLSALTDSESFDIVMSAGMRPWLRELAQVSQKVGPVHSGTCTKSLEGDIVASHRKDRRSRAKILWSTRCPWKRAHSCGRHSHEFT